jgi:predicted nucleic acid-binding protein
MPSYFFDSSAIVKRYHFEPGSAWVRSICDPRTRPPLYLAQLAQVEVVAALRRTGRREQLHPSFVETMVNLFARHLALSDPTRSRPMYRLVPLAPTVLELAADLCNRYWDVHPHPLRSLDAIQLAAALLTAAAIPDELHLVTADTRLGAVAPLEGLTVVNPLAPPPSAPPAPPHP